MTNPVLNFKKTQESTQPGDHNASSCWFAQQKNLKTACASKKLRSYGKIFFKAKK
jgi:hypothetical protein